MGSLKNRCFTESTGIVMDEDYLCGKKECPEEGGYICGKMNKNPNWGITNFDNIFSALL